MISASELQESLTRALMGIVAVVWLLGVASCDRSQQAGAAAAPHAPSVTVASAMARDVPVYIDEIGRCAAKESVTVQPQVDGRVEEAHFVEGASVKKGDLLFSIDARPFQADLDKAQATLAQNRENLKLAQLEWGRVEKLQGTSAMAQTDIDQKQSAVAVAEAQVRVAEAAVQTAKLNLEYTSIRSPISGRAGQRLVDPGNIVRSNESKLVVVQTMDPIYADFTVAENEFATVRKYIAEGALAAPTFADASSSTNPLKVEVDIPGESTKVLSALGSAPTSRPTTNATAPREGVLTFLDNTVQDATGTLKLRATIPNKDRYFWPGQFVNVRVILTVKKNAVLVPSAAVQISQQGPFVYVVGDDRAAQLRPISPGQRQGDLIVIEQGVAPGERVIVTGQLALAPNVKVNIAGDAAAQTGNAPAAPANSQPIKAAGAGGHES
jgi:multidrug efflux system membrane fusion protein